MKENDFYVDTVKVGKRVFLLLILGEIIKAGFDMQQEMDEIL